MTLIALTDEADVAQAVDQLESTLLRGAEKPYINIVTAGGGTHGVPVEVIWHRKLGFWAFIGEEKGGKRYWCCYGVIDPGKGDQRPIVQINSPIKGRNFGCQGAFARDESGQIYYLHTGRVMIQKRDEQRSAFAASGLWNGESATVVWPADDKSREMFVMGPVGDDQLISNLAAYVKAAAAYRLRYGATDQNPYRIFFSHSNHEIDKVWCEAFLQALQKSGADVWFDNHDLSPGVLDDKIRTEIQDRPIFVVAMSPRSMSSDYVRQEIGYALELAEIDSHRIVLPVMAEQSEVPSELASFVRVRGANDGGLPPEEAARQGMEMLRRSVVRRA